MDFNNSLRISGHKTGHRVRKASDEFIVSGYPDIKLDIVSGKGICHESTVISGAIYVEPGTNQAMYRATMARTEGRNLFWWRIGPRIGPSWPDSPEDNPARKKRTGEACESSG